MRRESCCCVQVELIPSNRRGQCPRSQGGTDAVRASCRKLPQRDRIPLPEIIRRDREATSRDRDSIGGAPIVGFVEWEKMTNSLGMTLVRIEPGSFLMGSSKDQIDHLVRVFPDFKRESFDDEQPQHTVKITHPFYLGTHQVTQGQYQAVMGNNPSHFKGSDDLPVENVSWLDAVEFCNKLSEREKRTPFYRIDGTEVTPVGGNGYRLPTEAEWEYACRAKSTTLYPFGDDASKLGEHAWSAGNSERKTHPVGQKLPNAWGLYDMLGNVWEWCADWYDEKYYASSPPADPPGASGASARVIRGGSWYDDPWGCRPANRCWYLPGCRSVNLGFRVAAVQE